MESPSRRVGKESPSVLASFSLLMKQSTSQAPDLTLSCSCDVEATIARRSGCFFMSSSVTCVFATGGSVITPIAARRSRFSCAAMRHLSTSRTCLPRSGPILIMPSDFDRYESVAIFCTSPSWNSSVMPWHVSFAVMSWREPKVMWMCGDKSKEIIRFKSNGFCVFHSRVIAPLSSQNVPPCFRDVSRGLPSAKAQKPSPDGSKARSVVPALLSA
mmetsp:Transcript_18389/g.47087  ORF Transcript_18389/g.47087 Transcript_18389/m.47087 type:complete len:215 (-) Transcript_18389:281-925(-)